MCFCSNVLLGNYFTMHINNFHFIFLLLRGVNVTIATQSILQCAQNDRTPKEYIIFCNLEKDLLRAVSITVWSEATDQRVWSALGK